MTKLHEAFKNVALARGYIAQDQKAGDRSKASWERALACRAALRGQRLASELVEAATLAFRQAPASPAPAAEATLAAPASLSEREMPTFNPQLAPNCFAGPLEGWRLPIRDGEQFWLAVLERDRVLISPTVTARTATLLHGMRLGYYTGSASGDVSTEAPPPAPLTAGPLTPRVRPSLK